MTTEVTLVYEFNVIVSKGASARSIVQTAWEQARKMFGHDEFVLTVEVEQHSGWAIRARAETEVGVNGAHPE